MFKIITRVARASRLVPLLSHRPLLRTFLSPAYYCNEIWEDRLSSPILQKVNLDIIYHELDQNFQKTRRISPVDVDIFANAPKAEMFVDELLDLIHKLRLSQDTSNTLNSTGHAVIRTLVNQERFDDLLRILDDRLNYGIFLDDYTANILMDKFWKSKNFVAGSIVASQMMLQEEFKHPLTINFALLHCYHYLLKPGEWPQPPKLEEPEEEVKIRVKYLRNPYNDERFDLRDPQKIVGKTMVAAAKNRNDFLHKSFRVVGLSLLEKEDLAKIEIENCKQFNVSLVKELMDFIPENSEIIKELNPVKLISDDVDAKLQKMVTESVAVTSEKDIAHQCEVFKDWETERMQALEEQKKRLLTAERLAEIERLKESLKDREQKLWFFENEENVELAIEEAEANIPPAKTLKQQKKMEEEYVPPEIR